MAFSDVVPAPKGMDCGNSAEKLVVLAKFGVDIAATVGVDGALIVGDAVILDE